MTSFARLTLLVLGAIGLWAPAASGQDSAKTALPEPLTAAVAGAVARAWSADSAAVRLEWGAVPAAAALTATTPFRLVGRGDHGTYVVLFEPAASSSAAVRVRAGVVDTMPVATRAIPKDVTIAAADIERRSSVRWGAPSRESAVSVEGWVTRRPVAAGEAIDAGNAAPPAIIRAGDSVQLEWSRGAVTVALEGVAMNAAGMGEPVKVRLPNRGGQRSGRVTGPGAARIGS